jgi:MFS family permease
MNPAEDGLPLPQRYWAILTLVVGMVVSVLDSSIANIALPTIARQIGATPAQSIWVINAYQLAVVVALLPLASLGDIFGYRRIYAIGFAVFTAAALVSALSHSLAMLATGRALQGVGSAGMMSVNTALVRFTYPRRQLGRGIAMTAVTVSVTSASGPTVAAAILAVGSWHWLFAINVPIGLVALVLSLRLLPRTPPSGHRFDLASAMLSAVAFALLIGGVNGIGHGQAGGFIAVELFGALAAGYILVRRQTRLPMPLLPVDLFRRPIFALSVAASVTTFVAQDLCHIAVLFPGRARPLAGRDRAVDDAVAGDGGGDRTNCRPARRPLSGRDPRRHRARRLEPRLSAAGLAAGGARDGRYPVADDPVRARLWVFPVAEQPRHRRQRAARAQRRRRRDPIDRAAVGADDRRGVGGADLWFCASLGRHRTDRRDPARLWVFRSGGGRQPRPFIPVCPRPADRTQRRPGRLEPAESVADSD